MIADNETVSLASLMKVVFPKMLELGLPAYESKVYLALLMEPNSQASRICELTGIPDSKIYSVLENAARRYMIEVQYGVPKLYRSSGPPVFLARVRESLSERYGTYLRIADELEARLQKLHELKSGRIDENGGMEIAYVVRGEGNIISKMKEMISSARTRVTLILPEEKYFRALRQKLLEARARKVVVRIAMPVLSVEVLENAGEEKYFDFARLTEECCDVWLLVSDGRLLNVSGRVSDSEVSSILTQDKNLVQMADAYFDSPSCCT